MLQKFYTFFFCHLKFKREEIQSPQALDTILKTKPAKHNCVSGVFNVLQKLSPIPGKKNIIQTEHESAKQDRNLI